MKRVFRGKNDGYPANIQHVLKRTIKVLIRSRGREGLSGLRYLFLQESSFHHENTPI